MKAVKTFIFILIVLVVSSSCSKNDHLAVIPSNAPLVLSIDVASLTKKSDLMNTSIGGQLDALLPLVFSDEAERQMKEYMQSPEEMGIDFREPIYIFRTLNGCLGITMKLHDKGDFEDFLSVFIKQNLASKAVERDKVKIGSFLDYAEYGYKGKTLLFVVPLGDGGSSVAKQTLSQLFNLQKDDSFVNTECFQKLSKLNGRDVSGYANMAALPQDFAIRVKSLIPSGVRITDVGLFSSLDFQKGKAVMTSQIEGTNDKVEKILDESNDNFHKIEGRYIDMPTDDFFLWGCIGAKGEWLLNKIKQDEQMKRTLFLMERGIDIEAMIKSVDGDLAVTLPNTVLMPYRKNTDFMACGHLKSSKFLDDVDYWQKSMKEYGMTMEKTGKNEYLLSGQDFKINWGVNDDDLYIGSNASYNLMANGKKSNLLKDYDKYIKESRAFVYINLTPLFNKESAYPSSPFGFKMPYISKLKALICRFKSVNELEFTVELTENDDNFLKELLN